ncbi:MAG: choice-of-anchor D domain-containing protein [Bacteroidetes bacterium]|nr:choice-of-anchor D domain-containing protein [Bacteroidota bacterium]
MKYIFHIVIYIGLFFGCFAEGSAQYWNKVNLPAGYANNYWLDIFFLPGNTQLGWACGFNSSVVRTTDGGNTWTGVKVTLAQNPMLESIHFVSSQIGFTSGPQGIWKSIDGGASWFDITPTNAQGSLWGCYFKDQNLGLVVGGGCGGPQLFYRTTDGGTNWTLFQGSEPQSGMCDLLLDQASDTGYASSSGVIWQSTNAGQTWSVFSRSNSFNAWQEEIAWLGNSFLVPWSGMACQGGGGGGGMCFTTNKGQSWNRVAAPDNLFGTYLTSSTTGWACGYDRSVYYTSNAGLTWEYRNCGTTGSLDDIRMFSDTSGWVVGEGIYKMIPGFHEVIPRNGLTFENTCVNSLQHDSIIIRNFSFESTIVSMTVNGPAASDFSIPFSTFPLGQCEERLVHVTFRPTASGIRNATIGISMINPLESFAIPLQGTASDITMNTGIRDTINIGSKEVGTTSDSSFMIHNRSDVDITLSAINPMDLPPGHTVLWNTALPLRIAARDSALLRYRIIMKDTGSTSQRFMFKFGMCDKTITMKSFGTSPRIASPENLIILANCNPEKDTTITISNVGNAPLVIDGFAISGGDSTAFSVLPQTLPITIALGRQIRVTIRLKKRLPLAPDALSRLLIFHSDTMLNRVSPRIVNLTGKRGYAVAGPLNDSLWAGKHCVGDKGMCSATFQVNGTGSTQIHGIISKTGTSTVISPKTFPVSFSTPLSATIETRTGKTGRYKDTLLVISGPCKDTIPIIIEAEAISTIIAFADSILTGTVDQGSITTLRWDLFSIGTALADIRRMTLRNNQQIKLARLLPNPSIINPGQSGEVSVTVTPTLTDTVLIDTLCVDATKECPTSICIPIRIAVRQARLVMSDTLIEFAMQCDTSAMFDTIMISNPGMLNDTLLSINSTSASNAFSHSIGTILPAVLKPSDSIPIIVRFSPIKQGQYQYALDITSTSGKIIGKNISIQVNGSYAAPDISVSPAIVDLGLKEPCSADTNIITTITNSGLKAGICNVVSNSKSLVLQDSLLTIPENGTISLPITFKPSLANIGTWKDSIFITDLTCNRRIAIQCSGIIDTISISVMPTRIDLGSIYRDDSSMIPVIIKNTSSFTIMLDSIKLMQKLPEYGISYSRLLPSLLNINDTMHVFVKAKALTEGTNPIDTLNVIAHRDCDIERSVPIKMSIPNEAYTATLKTEDYYVTHGDTLTIYCRLDGDVSMARLQRLSYDVKLDGTLFSILSTEPKASISKIDSLISWTIPVEQIPLKGGIISRIHGRALVTRHRKAPIMFSNIQPVTNRTITIDSINGSLTVTRICANDLTGFKLTSLLLMNVMPPHPIQEHIVIAYSSSTDESTTGLIKLYSLEGALLHEHQLIGGKDVQLYTIPHTLPAGTYILEMQSKQYVQREILLIAP